jgi:hypothetical protein
MTCTTHGNDKHSMVPTFLVLTHFDHQVLRHQLIRLLLNSLHSSIQSTVYLGKGFIEFHEGIKSSHLELCFVSLTGSQLQDKYSYLDSVDVSQCLGSTSFSNGPDCLLQLLFPVLSFVTCDKEKHHIVRYASALI